MQVFACFPVLHLQAYYSVMKHGWLITTRHILCPTFVGAKAAQVLDFVKPGREDRRQAFAPCLPVKTVYFL